MKAIFVINMARDADRWTAMRAHLVDDLGLSETTDFERFEAVDGKKFSEEVTAACRAFCTPTMRGCALSHMRLWKLGIERDLDAMLVLEDDARLAPNWREALDRAIAAVGNDTWDLIQLGTIAPRWNDERPPGPGVVRPKIFAGAHAYVISRRGMRHYVCAIRRAAFHVDIHMGATSRRGAVFLVDPPVATQAGMGENSTQFADGARAWPAALNGLLAAVSPKNQAAQPTVRSAQPTVRSAPPTVRSAPPLNYWATVPIAQIPVFGGVAINAWTLIFAILAVVAKKAGLAWLALLPVALAGLQPVATYSKDMAFCIFLFYGIYFLI